MAGRTVPKEVGYLAPGRTFQRFLRLTACVYLAALPRHIHRRTLALSGCQARSLSRYRHTLKDVLFLLKSCGDRSISGSLVAAKDDQAA